jgi:hypothetical protein
MKVLFAALIIAIAVNALYWLSEPDGVLLINDAPEWYSFDALRASPDNRPTGMVTSSMVYPNCYDEWGRPC